MAEGAVHPVRVGRFLLLLRVLNDMKITNKSFLDLLTSSEHCKLGYTPREPVISPLKPINRPLKTD
ncbi:hypothetical protein, partial [Staphylococcus aureus]|uniref:hypothetical protein n=1 Tax=Staphylococcus aureus TaxID=1280 RepID=UPI001CF5BF34